MTSFLSECLTGFLCLLCAQQDGVKVEAVFYEWTVQYWQWDTKELHPDIRTVPKEAKMIEVVLELKAGEEGFCQTTMEDRTFTAGIVQVVNKSINEPVLLLRCSFRNKKTREGNTANAEQRLSAMRLGTSIFISGGSERMGGTEVTHVHAYTYRVEQKTRKDLLRTINPDFAGRVSP